MQSFFAFVCLRRKSLIRNKYRKHFYTCRFGPTKIVILRFLRNRINILYSKFVYWTSKSTTTEETVEEMCKDSVVAFGMKAENKE